MKRLFCFLLIGMIYISLTACTANDNSGLDADELENTNNAIADYSDFEPVDLSYEHVANLNNFMCYVSYQENTLTLDGTRAKDLYNLVYSERGKKDHTQTSSDGNYVFLVFYNSEEELSSEYINATNFWGTYAIYDDGLLIFSGSPYHSAEIEYKVDLDLFDSVIDIIFSDR